MSTTIISLSNLKSLLNISEKLIQKQNTIIATLCNDIRTDTVTLKAGQRVKLLYRVTDDRYGVTADLYGQTTQAILHESQLKDIHLSK